ncbi:MAG: glutamine amidotransferase-related protein [Acidimicrobiales bacterium]
MRIGLLLCGHVHPDLIATFGDYPVRFTDLLGSHDITIQPYDVVDSPPPPTHDCDGWLVSGSAASTYEPLPWIAPMEAFLRAAVADGAPTVAICFGHQLLAQALGGRVEHAPGGWGAGAHRYDLDGGSRAWMGADPPPSVRLIASHQDQVALLPKGAELLARTEHCRVAAYTVGDRALAIQPHPEYSVELSRQLSATRREVMGPEVADAAAASLDQPIDSALVGRWMAAFLHREN